MKNILILVLSLVISLGYGQSRKTIKTNNVKSIVTWNYDKTGKKTKKSVETYDVNGNLIDIIKYDSTGKQKSHVANKYDKENNKIEETTFEVTGKIKKVNKYTYRNGLKTEKNVYDGNNNLKSKKVYEISRYNNE